jgi:hypothetical protein
MRLAALCLVGLFACGETTSEPGDPNVIDRMRVTNPVIFFTHNDIYVVANYWEATNGVGEILPLVDTLGKAIKRGLRYGFGDSVASQSLLVDSTGGITLPVFTGHLYLFAPTARNARELMGSHYINAP